MKIRVKAYDLVTLFADTSKKRREKIRKKYGFTQRDVRVIYRNLCKGKWRVMVSN